MKNKKYKERYSKKVSKTNFKEKKLVDIRWIVTITMSAFIISILFSLLSEMMITNVHVVISLLLVLLVIMIGVFFDMVGVASTVASLSTFNSMATKRVKGAKMAVKWIKNADKVSSFCNDVIGDICGIISGSAGSVIAIIIANNMNVSSIVVTLIVTSLIASLTIGGKAIGKSIAINKCDQILYFVTRICSVFSKK